MKEIRFATPETLKQPNGGLVVEAPEEQDHILGGPLGPDFDVVCEDGHWAMYAPEPEIQRNRHGDTFMCVSFSKNNINEFLVKKQYGELINWSDIFLGSGSGTTRGRGHSKRAVAEWQRLNGFVVEEDYPYTDDMTLDQVYAQVPKNLLEKGKKNLSQYTFKYKWLTDNSVKSLLNGLKFSPLQVDVLGRYRMDDNGFVIWEDGYSYMHEVVLFDYEMGKCWWVFDSEASQFLRFSWDYPFGSPMIHAISRNMHIEILKKKGQKGLAVKTFGEPSLIVFSGGSVVGEALFKSIYGVASFDQIPIKEVAEWPYPIRHMLNCNPYRA